MVEIINKISFPLWEEFQKSSSFNEKIKTICFSISDFNKEGILASCQWCNDMYSTIEWFKYSEEGYKSACEWIEERRLYLINKLI